MGKKKVDGHEYFHLLAAVNSAAVKILGTFWYKNLFSILWGLFIPRN